MSCLVPLISRATAMSIPPSDPRRTWRIQAVIFSVVVSGLACLAVHGLSSMCLGWHWHDLKGNHALRPTRRDRTGSIRMGGRACREEDWRHNFWEGQLQQEHRGGKSPGVLIVSKRTKQLQQAV